jgi:hypothetical protein
MPPIMVRNPETMACEENKKAPWEQVAVFRYFMVLGRGRENLSYKSEYGVRKVLCKEGLCRR